MSANSSIEWTDRTWNPIRGCSMISPGCKLCYAMKFAHRFSGKGKPYEGLTELGPEGPRWNGKIRLVSEALDQPLRWRKPQRVFVNSMSDLFHEDVPFWFVDQVFGAMAACPEHVFQILTKRPARMAQYLCTDEKPIIERIEGWSCNLSNSPCAVVEAWPLPNVWLGISAENQEYFDSRIDALLKTPAAVRFVSYEPALGPLDAEICLSVVPADE